jgi:hypothetical protein
MESDENDQNNSLNQTQIETRKRSVKEWFAEIDRLRGGIPFPEREAQPLAEIRDYFD